VTGLYFGLLISRSMPAYTVWCGPSFFQGMRRRCCTNKTVKGEIMLEVIDTKSVDAVGTSESLHLNLEVSDLIVVQYLRASKPQDIEMKAAEALKVGVIALRSVSPTLDASIVEQKFKDLERSLDDHARDFKSDLQAKIEQYFKSETGSVPRHLDSLIGEDGALSKTLEEYFGLEHGRLSQVVRDQVGPHSDFGKLVDPDNNRGLLQRIQDVVALKLQESSSSVLQQFSFDSDDSALSRLRREVNKQVEAIKQENAQFFAELKAHFGIQQARKEEACKGTQKGRDFEALVYEHVAALGRSLGDITENLTGTPGNIPRCKTGDYVSTLSSESGALGKKFVIEAKNEQGYSLRDSIEELARAKENRDACVGMMIFTDECCPPEIGKFRIVGDDILLSINPDSIVEGEPNFYLESAYRIARAIVVAERNQQLISKVDVARINAALAAIEAICERFAEIHKKAASVKQSASAIEELAAQMRPEIEHRLREVELLAGAELERSGPDCNPFDEPRLNEEEEIWER